MNMKFYNRKKLELKYFFDKMIKFIYIYLNN